MLYMRAQELSSPKVPRMCCLSEERASSFHLPISAVALFCVDGLQMVSTTQCGAETVPGTCLHRTLDAPRG